MLFLNFMFKSVVQLPCWWYIVQASYGVSEPEFAVTQLAQTTMRSEIGKINLDNVFKEREILNDLIVSKL